MLVEAYEKLPQLVNTVLPISEPLLVLYIILHPALDQLLVKMKETVDCTTRHNAGDREAGDCS